MLKETKSKYCTSESIILYTESFGDPNHPACLLIAGAGASAKFWSDFLCEMIAEHDFFVIRYDHRDIGLSSAVDYSVNPYTVFDLANDAISILKDYNIKQAHVVGHSMGGIIAQILAVEYPESVITFTSMSVGINSSGVKPSQEVMDILLQNQPAGNYEDDIAGFMKSWHVLNGKAPLDQKLASDYTKDLYIRSIHKVGVAWNHINSQKDISLLLQKISQNQIPGLFIHGREDPLIPVADGVENARITPHAYFEVIDDMGHMFFNQDIEKHIVSLLLSHFKSKKTVHFR